MFWLILIFYTVFGHYLAIAAIKDIQKSRWRIKNSRNRILLYGTITATWFLIIAVIAIFALFMFAIETIKNCATTTIKEFNKNIIENPN